MKALNYVRNGLIGLSMLASTVLGFEPSLRQVEVSSGYTQDSAKTGFVQVHQQFEKSDGLLNYQNTDGTNHSIDGYLNLNVKHLLGEGNAFYEGRGNVNGKYWDETHIGSLEHTLIDFNKFKIIGGLGKSLNRYKEIVRTITDTSIAEKTATYEYNGTIVDTIVENRSNELNTKQFSIGVDFSDILKSEFTCKNISNNFFNDKNEVIYLNLYYPSFNDSSNTITRWFNPFDNTIDVKQAGFDTEIKIWKLALRFLINNSGRIDSAYQKTKTITSSFPDTATYITYHKRSEGNYRQLSLNGTLNNFLFINNLSLLYSSVKGVDEENYFEEDWLPNKASSEGKTNSEIKAVNLLSGKNVLHNLKLRLEDYSYRNRGDSTVLGFNPDIARESRDNMNLSYDLYIPFSSWSIDNLADFLTFRFFEDNVEAQENLSLRLNQPRRTQWKYSPIPKTKIHFAYKTEQENLFDDKHNSEIIEAGLKHCVLNLRNLKLSPFYNISNITRTNSIRIDSINYKNDKSFDNINEAGLEAIINDYLISASVKFDKDKSFRIYIQKTFSPIKREWFE